MKVTVTVEEWNPHTDTITSRSVSMDIQEVLALAQGELLIVQIESLAKECHELSVRGEA